MKILKSVSMIAVVVAVAGGATYAYFSDTETSSGNTITAGTLDLEIGAGASLPMVVENAYPGMPATSKVFKVKNAGSINGHLRFPQGTMSLVGDENGVKEPEGSDSETAGELCGNVNVVVTIQDTNGSNPVQLYSGPLMSLVPTGNALLPASTERDIKIEV